MALDDAKRRAGVVLAKMQGSQGIRVQVEGNYKVCIGFHFCKGPSWQVHLARFRGLVFWVLGCYGLGDRVFVCVFRLYPGRSRFEPSRQIFQNTGHHVKLWDMLTCWNFRIILRTHLGTPWEFSEQLRCRILSTPPGELCYGCQDSTGFS